jgi:hypothetical protein
MELLRRECLAFANDGDAILTVEIGALDRTIVLARNAHVGPVNVSGFNIDDDAIRDSSAADNDFSVRPVGVSRMNPAAACFEEKQSACCRGRRCAIWFGNFGNTFHALISYFFLKLSNGDILEILTFVRLRVEPTSCRLVLERRLALSRWRDRAPKRARSQRPWFPEATRNVFG